MTKEHKSDKVKVCLHWFFQILCWGAIVGAVFIFLKNPKNKVLLLIICAAVYLLYLIIEFASNTSSFLCNIKSVKSCYNAMRELFKTPPVIEFNSESYHYDELSVRGENVKVKKKKKIVTSTNREEMGYYSYRDVSGQFTLNKDEATIRKKKYIKFHLEYAIDFDHELSYMDYVDQFNLFKENNRYTDLCVDYDEKRYIPGFEELTMVKIGKEDPCFVHFFWFFLFTIIPFAEFYKIYVESLCIHQEFKIWKIISTRFDLNSPENAKVFQNLVPKLNLILTTYTFSSSDYYFVNNNFTVEDVTEKDKIRARQYRNKIPNYNINNVGTVIVKPKENSLANKANLKEKKGGEEEKNKIDNKDNSVQRINTNISNTNSN